MPPPAPPKVSVILPVFKARDYIAAAIASLQRQTLQDIEFIFVDDCGGDGTADIIGQAALADPRIRLLRNPANAGPGPSRNRGLAAARGEYVAFMDADDWVDDDFYRRLYDVARPARLAFAKAVRIRHEKDGSTTPSTLNDRIRRGTDAARPLYFLFTFEHQAAIFSRNFLLAAGAAYGTSRHDQDTTFLLRALYTPPGAPPPPFALVDDVAYHYRQIPSSLVHSRADSFFLEHVRSYREKIEFLAPRAPRDPFAYPFAARRFALFLRLHYPKIQDAPGREACRIAFLAGLLEAAHLLPDMPCFAAQPALRRYAPLFALPWPLSDADRAALPGIAAACRRPPLLRRAARLLRRLFRRLAPRPLRRRLKAILAP